MNMASMGGPVGGGGPIVPQMNAGTPSNSMASNNPAVLVKRLNTAIYDYLLRNQLYDIAKSFQAEMAIETKDDMKQSPNQRNGLQLNGVEDGLDDKWDEAILKRPDGLPLPNMGNSEGPFLQDWWCQFWEIFSGHHGRSKNNTTMNYLAAQRAQQNGRMSMMQNVNPNAMQQRGMNMMPGMNNGMADMRKQAIQQRGNM